MDNYNEQHQSLLHEKRRQVAKYKTMSTLAWIVAVVVLVVAAYSIAKETGGGFLLVIVDIAVFILALMCTGRKGAYAEELSALEAGWDEYIALLDRRKEQRRQFDAQQEAIRQRELEEQARREAVQHLECPLCGSINTRRISTLNRSVSVSAFGLASDKIGKQYECLNCKHKW